MPEGGLPWSEFARRKFGGEAGASAAFVAAAGESDGVRFDFDRVTSAPNTVDAHRLILFAQERGLQWETADVLFRAYFTEGRNLNERGQLVDLATGAGLAAGEVNEYLTGASGVPFCVFDGRYALSGAQPVGVFGQAIGAAASQGFG